MKVETTKRFLKQFLKCPKEIQNDVSFLLDEISIATNLHQINNIKKLQGYKNYYRYKKGSWRVGMELEENVVVICIIHAIGKRGDFYNYFPPNK